MRRLVIGVVAGMLLPLSPAFAEADAAIVSQVQAATQEASTPEQIAAAVQQMLEGAETPEQQQAILTAAMSLYASNQDALSSIGTAAKNAGVPTNTIVASAKDAGVSPAVAVGVGIPGSNGTPVAPPSTSGGSGGGTASPS
ncbi:hypothetical protein KDX31_14070 [Amphritea atlantica]|uniref:Uncharacterized protein n=1 Tax=Amphritea atlantica TaxID=355243 RepID=A0ABY5GR78_9GAMM|nr:hypothetical protein KDX31_14070 [Amphritea atlantica]